MRFWTNDEELVEVGSRYLRLVSLSYLFSGLTQPYVAVMRSCERVKFSMVLSMITLSLNVLLNAVLIFGLLGMPALGIEGAAIATSISRGVELLICLIDFSKQKILPRNLRNMFHLPRTLLQDFRKYALPAFLNDVLWGFAYNMNSVIMGHLGSDIVAANSVAAVARDLVTTVGFGLSAASSIMIGKEVGAGHTDMARKDADSVMVISLLTTLVKIWAYAGSIVSQTSFGYVLYTILLRMFMAVAVMSVPVWLAFAIRNLKGLIVVEVLYGVLCYGLNAIACGSDKLLPIPIPAFLHGLRPIWQQGGPVGWIIFAAAVSLIWIVLFAVLSVRRFQREGEKRFGVREAEQSLKAGN